MLQGVAFNNNKAEMIEYNMYPLDQNSSIYVSRMKDFTAEYCEMCILVMWTYKSAEDALSSAHNDKLLFFWVWIY